MTTKNELENQVVQSVPSWTWMLLMIICIILLIAGGISYYYDEKQVTKQEEARADSTKVSQQQNTPTPNPWSSKTIDIPREGVVVYLYPGWTVCPLGGAITITPITFDGKKGVTLHDAPGEINHFPYQPEGNFLILGDPVGSKRSVQIYNRW